MGNEGNYKLIRFPKNKKFSKNFQISYKKDKFNSFNEIKN